MPSIDLITTTAGRAAILAAVSGSTHLTVSQAMLSGTHQAVGVGTTTLSSVVAILAATGSVRLIGGQYSMHVVIKDDSASAYDVRALALVLSDATTLLFVYSQSGLIATKSASASLHIAFDLTIDASTGAVITFGTTDYSLPMASEAGPGIAEMATIQEVAVGTDTARMVSPRGTRIATDESLTMQAAVWLAAVNRAVQTPGSSFAGTFVTANFSNNTYIATGSGGGTPEVQTSPDGTTWTRRTVSAGANPIRGSVYGPSLHVVGHGGSTGVHTSPDAVTWTARTTTGYCNALAWGTVGGGRFVVVGPAGFIATSPDGITWTTRTAASSYSGDFKDVTAVSTGFVACGTAGEIQQSADGITWTRVKTSGPQVSCLGYASAVPFLIAVADGGVVWVSYDFGLTWSSTVTLSGATTVSSVKFVNGCFVVCASNFVFVVSARGTRFKRIFNTSGLGLLSAAYTEDSYLLFVGSSGRIEKSTLVV